MRIARFRWWHISAALPIERDLFGAERWSATMFWNELANGNRYIAALEDGLIGYAGVALSPPTEAWINNIAVRRDRQRHGVGRALLEELLAIAGRAGIAITLLEVARDNVPAQRLYDEYGFEVIGLRKGYYQPSNTDALIMRREEAA
jgi:ribosomal-protein-alanine N-acetyltransferase